MKGYFGKKLYHVDIANNLLGRVDGHTTDKHRYRWKKLVFL